MTPPDDGSEPAARVVLVTAPDLACARELAHALVEQRLAACVTLVPGVTSVYRWNGRLQEDGEVLLVVKASAERLVELEEALVRLHPYEVPEFVALAPAHVESRYLDWLLGESSATSSGD